MAAFLVIVPVSNIDGLLVWLNLAVWAIAVGVALESVAIWDELKKGPLSWKKLVSPASIALIVWGVLAEHFIASAIDDRVRAFDAAIVEQLRTELAETRREVASLEAQLVRSGVLSKAAAERPNPPKK
jgi:hypothetical protein